MEYNDIFGMLAQLMEHYKHKINQLSLNALVMLKPLLLEYLNDYCYYIAKGTVVRLSEYIPFLN